MDRLGLIVLGLLVGFGITLGSFFIGHSILHFRQSGRYVTVKGLAEREVDSDLAIWKIRFKSSGNDLSKTFEKITHDIKIVEEFLKTHGLKEEEFETVAPRVIDLFAREYGPERLPPNRYIIEAMINVKSKQVAYIEKASKKAIELIKAGVVLDEGTHGANPAYIFTKLNDIRPDMLKQATESARKLAEQFAADSGSKVGPIRQANQGVFTIKSDIESDNGFGNEHLTSKKRVRVVSTLDYFLID